MIAISVVPVKARVRENARWSLSVLLVVRDDQVAEPQRAAEDGKEKNDVHPKRIGCAADGPKGEPT
jgi:hypothetical protein